MALAKTGDIIQLVGRDKKYFVLRLEPGARLETHRGIIEHTHLIGSELGTEIRTHLGHAFLLLEPSTDDLIRDIKRSSQIIFPKDIGFILMKLAIRPGVTVVEAGSGSGGLTTVLAQIVGPTGRIISYDIRADMQKRAQKNIDWLGLNQSVTFKLRDIAEGFDETEVDALFLDVPNPWDYTGQARRALKGGGFFGSLVPTANQVSDLLIALNRDGYEFVEVCEILLRYYKAVPARLRPSDRMVAHTGYLIFARPVTRVIPLPSLAADDEIDETEPEIA